MSMAHYVLSTVLEALYALTPLILTKTQEGSYHYYP